MRQQQRGADGLWARDSESRVSLVGPRPEMASNAETFSAVIPFYNLRYEVRPGLTGWARTEEVMRKLCYDLSYIKHLALRFDLRILSTS